MQNTHIVVGQEAVEALNREEGRHTFELAQNLVGGFAEDFRKLIGDTLEEEDVDWESVADYTVERIEQSKSRGEIAAVLHNEKPVGVAGYKKIGQDPHTGKTVYEIIHLSILEEIEGKGYGKQLVETLIQKIHAEDPEADIACTVTSDAVIRLFSKFGFEPISTEYFYQIEQSKLDVSEFREAMERRENNGVRFFLRRQK